MVNSISGSTLGHRIGVMDKVPQEQLYNPGLYSLPELMPPPQRKYDDDGGFLAFLGKVLLAAVVVGGVAIGARKTIMDDYKVLENLPEKATRMQKFKNEFAKYTDIVYDNTVAKIINLFKGEKAKGAEAPKEAEKP